MSRRRFLLVAAVVGMSAACVLTWPLAVHLRSVVLDDGSLDAYQFLWNLWWVPESLGRLHTNPFFTRYLYYPEGVPLLLHTLCFTFGLVTWPLQALLPGGVVTAHNLLVLAAPVLAVVFGALLAREVTGDPVAALAGGLVVALNPIAVWFVPIPNLNCSYLVTALVWSWWRLHRRARARDVALPLGFLVALVFASPEYAIIGLAALALDSAWRLLAPSSFAMPRWNPGFGGFWAGAVAILCILALAARTLAADLPPRADVILGSAYASGFVTPPWLSPPPARFYVVFYLGTIPLLLAAVAVALRGRGALFWATTAIAMALIALGPYVHLRHPFPDLQVPAGGPPFSGVPGPYLLAMKLVPLLAFSRAAFRWVVGAQLALAVLTAIALTTLRARATATNRLSLTLIALGALVMGAAVDASGIRTTVASVTIPAAYAVLRDDPEPSAALELPSGLVSHTFALLSSLYMYYQTSHRKLLLEGTIARLPSDRVAVLGREITDLAALPYVKYVVVHRDLLARTSPSSRAQTQRLEALARANGEGVADDGAVAVYRLRTFRPESVR